MWLINSSIGRKVIMSVTGMALILFMTFHCCMNLVALFSGKAYNMDLWAVRCQLVCCFGYCRSWCFGSLSHCLCIHSYCTEPSRTWKWALCGYRKACKCRVGKPEHAGTWYHRSAWSWSHFFNFWYNMMFAELLASQCLIIQLMVLLTFRTHLLILYT